MKRFLMAGLVGAMLIPGAAFAAEAQYPADCHLDGINAGLDNVIAQIKSSPANGHAGGHYGKALKDLEGVRHQLHEGCGAWNKDQAKAAAKGAKTAPAPATPAPATPAPATK